MYSSRADRRAQERRQKKNKRRAQVASVSVLATMGMSMAPAANAAVLTLPVAPTVVDSCGVANDKSILSVDAGVNWYEVTGPAGSENYALVSGDVAASGLDVTFAAQPAVAGDTFSDGSVEVRFPVTYTDVACTVTTPAEPTFTDLAGVQDDTVVIPATEGVEYSINGTVTTAGTYPASGTVTVTAAPLDGYAFAAGDVDTWTNTFSSAAAPATVTPPAPTFTDVSGTANDTYTIPRATDVSYVVDGNVVDAGVYPAVGQVTIDAVVDASANLTPGATTSWTNNFNAAVTDVVVSPAAPTFTDVSGTANDTYTIPVTTGVEYVVDGLAVAAGTYPATGDVTVEAMATVGYSLDPTATSVWNNSFSAAVDAVVVVAPEPAFNDLPGTADDTYVIPDAVGVAYEVDGVVATPGTHAGSGTIAVQAVALDGYALDADATALWNFTFDTADVDTVVTAAAPTFTDMPGTANDKLVIPNATGVDYEVNGVVTAAGTYPGTGDVTVQAVAQTGYALDPEAASVWNFSFSTAAEAIAVTPAAPTFTDVSGTENDVIVIPETTGVNYLIGGEVATAGEHAASGRVTVVAEAQPGYVLAAGATTEWTKVFSPAVDAVVTTAVPPKPVVTASLNVITIPDVEGLQYFINGDAVDPGDHAITADAVVTVEAKDGYALPAGAVASWNVSFTPAPGSNTGNTGGNNTPGSNTGNLGGSDGVLDSAGDVTADPASSDSGSDQLAETGLGGGMMLLMGAGGVLTAAGAGAVGLGRRRKSAEA